MRVYTGTLPLWSDTASFPRFSKLERDEQVDVLVIGAGISGLTAAYLLSLEGKRVAVIDRERCAQIDTGHTSAHLTMVTDSKISELTSRFGREAARAAWDGGLAAIAQIEEIVRAEEIDCDFVRLPGYLHVPLGTAPRDGADMFREEAAAAAALGFDAVFVDDVPFVGGPGIRYGNQARFHPRKYLAGVARALADRGGMIFEHTNATDFSSDPLRVTAGKHTIACGDVVLATHTPLTGNASLLGAMLFQTKLALYTSYVVAGEIEKGRVPDALFWDVADPYHYLRLEPKRDRDLVLFGGEDHKTGQEVDTNACFERLERTLATIVPAARSTHRWSGQVIETPDGLPFIGETAPHQFAGTGFSGNGMTFGTLTALMAVDRVLGRANPWTDLFDPARKKIGAAFAYVRENKDYPYYMLRDRVTPSAARSTSDIARGTGGVVQIDGEAVAVYRDESGKTTKVSAICTHMGCAVEWNAAEHTWDCPCHGSRFKVDGKVIAGPAESPLEAK